LSIARAADGTPARDNQTVMSEIKRRRLVIHGRVQGVNFRNSVRRCALGAGVAGWARNLRGGSIEVVLEGADEAVAGVEAFCRAGPSHARVESVDVREETPEGLGSFEVRR
jgi:acylphosphatase